MKLEGIIIKDFIKFSIPNERALAIETMKKNNVSELIATKEDSDLFLGIITINDILSKPAEEQLALVLRREVPVINKKGNVEDALSLFLTGDFYYLPVVEDNNLIGIISLNKILPVLIKKYKINKKISDIIYNNIFMGVWERTPTYIASKIMQNFKVSFLGIFDDLGKFVGILDSSDLIKAGEILSGVTESDATKGESGDDWDWNWKSSVIIGTSNFYLSTKPVSSYMKKEFSKVNQNLLISEAIQKLEDEDTRYLVVIENNDKLVAILRDIDILKTFKDTI